MCSVREKTPQRVSQLFFFSQKNTDEQNTQGFTETLSQPISQNLTATFSYKASVKSVCRRRSVESKQCAKRFCKICEFCEKKTYPASLAIVLFLTENTEEQNTQRSTETLSQPISQNLTATEASPHCPTPFKNMPHSFQEHALLHSRTCPSTAKNTPFLMLDRALLHRSLQPPDFMYDTETDETYILNENLIYKDIMT